MTTTTLMLKDIDNQALRNRVKFELTTLVGGTDLTNTISTVANGGQYLVRPGKNNPIGQALWEAGHSQTDTFDYNRSSNNNGSWDLLVVHDNSQVTQQQKQARSHTYLSKPDATGRRHVLTY